MTAVQTIKLICRCGQEFEHAPMIVANDQIALELQLVQAAHGLLKCRECSRPERLIELQRRKEASAIYSQWEIT